MQSNIANRSMYCHDNLEILQGINSSSIDLIYLDPPFNTKKTFTAPIGSTAKGAKFADIFTAEKIKFEWVQTVREDNDKLYSFLVSVLEMELGIFVDDVQNKLKELLEKAKRRPPYNFCYLAYMAIRLIEMHRILKDTGSIYLHCDPTMSHYIKLLLDCIFGEGNFQNEIAWCYTGPANVKSRYPRKHDCIYLYSKSKKYCFNFEAIKIPYSEAFLNRRKYTEGMTGITAGYSAGRSSEEVEASYSTGKIPEDWWADIPAGGQISKLEQTGYPTQKPIALLERIIRASSKEDDIVLDPFCGCATTCIAAERLQRNWIGIDVSHEAYELVKDRLKKEVSEELEWKDKIAFEVEPPQRTDLGEDYRLKKWVYIMANPKYPGEYKVGIASNWESRLNSYQTGDPDRGYTIEYKILSSHFREIEAHIHETFPNKREWVQAELADIERVITNYRPELSMQ